MNKEEALERLNSIQKDKKTIEKMISNLEHYNKKSSKTGSGHQYGCRAINNKDIKCMWWCKIYRLFPLTKIKITKDEINIDPIGVYGNVTIEITISSCLASSTI